eukprot:IDg10269t1
MTPLVAVHKHNRQLPALAEVEVSYCLSSRGTSTGVPGTSRQAEKSLRYARWAAPKSLGYRPRLRDIGRAQRRQRGPTAPASRPRAEMEEWVKRLLAVQYSFARLGSKPLSVDYRS